MTYRPDALDRALLERLQYGIPLTGEVWDSIGSGMGITGEDVLRRLRMLHAGNVLRSIGPVIDPGEVGLGASSLIALRVPEGRIEEVAAIINEYREVSHNYRRDNPYNLWFTLTGPSWEELDRVREEIRDRAGLGNEDMLDLPRRKRFKIGVRFHIQEKNQESDR
jgi:DNA-binding Lrp family transcriptional regulator